MAAGTELAAAYVSLTISANQIAPQVNKQLGAVEKQADKSGKAAGSKFSSGMGGAFKGLAGMFAGAMAGLAVKNFLGDALAEARESQKVGALTASIIKSTGGAAKISAGQIGSLADSISRKTGVDDEAIQTGANLLLTFKNVRNEAGKGSDVFNRATAAALDLSKAGFGSVDGAAKMLGKALNDPIKGITALGRAGVTFTDEQKKQIKTLTESGNVLGAQKIIMAEVESQVGGAAAATATAGEKARVTFDNLKESAGTYLLPIVDDLATKFTTLVEQFQSGTGAGGRFKVAVVEIKDAAVGLVDSFRGGVAFVREHQTAITALGIVIATIATPAVVAWSVATVVAWAKVKIAAIQGMVASVRAHTATALGWVRSGAAALASGAQTVAIWTLYKVEAIKGAAATVAAHARMALAWTASKAQSVAAAVATGAAWVAQNARIAVSWVATTAAMVAHKAASLAVAAASKVMAAGQWLVNAALTANPIGLVVAAIAGLIAIVVLAYQKNETFRKIVDAAWAGIKAAISAVVDWFRNTAWPWMRDAFTWIGDKAKWLWSTIIKPYFTAMWTLWGTVFRFLRDTVWPIARDAFANIAAKGKWMWENVLKPAFDAIKTGVGRVKDAFETAKNGIGAAWGELEGLAKKPVKFIIQTVLNDGLIAGFNWLSGKIGGPNIGNIPLPKGFATGGVLPGYTPGRDVHDFYSPTGGRLALSGGEAIMRPEFTRLVGGKAGVDRLNAMARAGNVPMQAFAGGGVVNWIKSKGSGALDWALKKAGAVWDAMKDPAKYLLDKLPSVPGGSALAGMGGAVKDKLVGLAAAKVKELFSSFSSALSQEQAAKAASSVGGMYSGKGGGGNALNRVRGMLIPGTQVTSTYRSPGRNAAVGGSRTSYHMDARNPAVDIGGATAALDRLYPILRAAGGWRELIWRAPGHYDHIHAAKDGGVLPKPLLFDRGGILPMGTSLVRNDTGAPEPLARVGHDSGRREPLVVNLVLPDGRVLTSAVIDDLGGRR